MIATRTKATKLLAVALAAAVGLSPGAVSADEPQNQDRYQVDQALVVDQSQSMEKDERLDRAKQAAMFGLCRAPRSRRRRRFLRRGRGQSDVRPGNATG